MPSSCKWLFWEHLAVEDHRIGVVVHLAGDLPVDANGRVNIGAKSCGVARDTVPGDIREAFTHSKGEESVEVFAAFTAVEGEVQGQAHLSVAKYLLLVHELAGIQACRARAARRCNPAGRES